MSRVSRLMDAVFGEEEYKRKGGLLDRLTQLERRIAQLQRLHTPVCSHCSKQINGVPDYHAPLEELPQKPLEDKQCT